jgi:imidazole glycerol-phosphate synthase subunit HisH
MNQPEIFLVDSGTGNLHSVAHTLLSLGAQVRLVRQADDLRSGGRVILPGVGAFGKFMRGLNASGAGLAQALSAAVQRGDPLLGICVGMQALFEMSEEMGEFAGLGILQGRVVRFPEMPGFKVPHTGWNQLTPLAQVSGSLLLNGLAPGAYAYFNHSFYCAPAHREDITAVTDHGVVFPSMVQHDNVMGVQFHPEKSQQTGLKVLENFIKT